MTVVGLFEAKTKLSEICAKVAAEGRGVVITRRGKPLVKIEPITEKENKDESVWDLRERYEKEHGPLTEEFELPKRQKQRWKSVLED